MIKFSFVRTIVLVLFTAIFGVSNLPLKRVGEFSQGNLENVISIGQPVKAASNWRSIMSQMGAKDVSSQYIGKTLQFSMNGGGYGKLCLNFWGGANSSSYLHESKPKGFLAKCGNTDAEQFVKVHRHRHGGVLLEITGLKGYSINIQGDEAKNGGAIGTWKAIDTNSADMRFYLYRLPNGKIIIVHHTGFVIDSPGRTPGGTNGSTGKMHMWELVKGENNQHWDVRIVSGGSVSTSNTTTAKPSVVTSSQRGRTNKMKVQNEKTGKCIIVPDYIRYGQKLTMGNCNSRLAVLEMNVSGSYLGRPNIFLTASRRGGVYDVSVNDQTVGGMSSAYIGKNPNRRPDDRNTVRILENGKSGTFRIDLTYPSKLYNKRRLNNSDCLSTVSGSSRVYSVRCNSNSSNQRWKTISANARLSSDGKYTLTGWTWVPFLYEVEHTYYINITKSHVLRFCQQATGNNVGGYDKVGNEIICKAASEKDVEITFEAGYEASIGAEGGIGAEAAVAPGVVVNGNGGVNTSHTVTIKGKSVVTSKIKKGDTAKYDITSLCSTLFFDWDTTPAKNNTACKDTYSTFELRSYFN